MGESKLPSNACFLGPIRDHNPNNISIGSAIFAGLTTVTDKQADHTTLSITTGHIYVALRCSLIIHSCKCPVKCRDDTHHPHTPLTVVGWQLSVDPAPTETRSATSRRSSAESSSARQVASAHRTPASLPHTHTRTHTLVKVLRPTRHKMGHFGDVPQASLLAAVKKNQNLTQQHHTFTNQKKYTTTHNKQKK